MDFICIYLEKFVLDEKSVVISFIHFFISCDLKFRDSEAHLPGLYVYELGTRLYHTLEVYDDFTFQQYVYSEKEGKLLHENKGKTFVNNSDIEFENWI